MKHYIVSWWNGEAEVWADNADAAKAEVEAHDCAYRYYGRRAPLFCEEIHI